VADTLGREFRIDRGIDPIFTMAPDEIGDEHLAEFLTPEPEGRGVELRFGILCRLTEQKGIPYILGALKRFKQRHGDVRFTFAGFGPLEQTIADFAASEGLDHVVIVPVTRPPEVLKEMDVFVHPGIDDAMPVSMVEALMCGRPCIGTRVGGVPDLVRDGVEGLLVEPRSAEQVFEAMDRFAAMPGQELAAFRRRARARYEQCCRPEKVGAVVEEHYRAILRDTMGMTA
jgi:glycosyltransferase involved in cell wall biosynthesis